MLFMRMISDFVCREYFLKYKQRQPEYYKFNPVPPTKIHERLASVYGHGLSTV